jgi:hypothetical protein
MKEIRRDTQKWEELFDKYDKRQKVSSPRPRMERNNFRRHKGGGISRSTLARLAHEDLDGDEE